MTENDQQKTLRRTSMTRQERREQTQHTHDIAMSAIAAEADARRRKTELLRAAREAATSKKAPD
jgi:hypothetical protein